MKVVQHIEQLLRQGRKPQELSELGFPKAVVTRVHRRLKEEKAALQPRTAKDRSRSQSAVTSPAEMALIQQKLASLESEIRHLEPRLEVLEGISMDLKDIQAHLYNTPTVGLKRRFTCDCGASGLVAVHIKCTKCGKETWWGWSPEQ